MEDDLFEDEKFDRYIKKLYASKRLLKKKIRNMESHLALNIVKSSVMSFHIKNESLSIESTLEFFLTWRLKMSTYPEKMWCDGVKDLSLTYMKANSLKIQALIYIGRENNNCENLYWCQFTGLFVFDRKHKTFKSYILNVFDQDKIYSVVK